MELTPVVQATVRHALSRGYLTQAQLREALILHEQLEGAGRTVPLLSVLGARYLRPEHVQELSQFYRDRMAGQATDPPPIEPKLEIPPEVLSRSCELVLRPPEQ